MSITSDIRSYADTALVQGKQVVGQGKAQITDVTSKATATASDLRAQAEKTLNIDGIKTAVEPYLSHAKQYRTTVTDRAEDIYKSVKSDKRVARVVATAESLTGVVVETVQQRVVKPVVSLTGRKPAKKPAAKRTTKASTTKAASTRPAKKTAAKKAPAKKATTARKAPAKKAAQS